MLNPDFVVVMRLILIIKKQVIKFGLQILTFVKMVTRWKSTADKAT